MSKRTKKPSQDEEVGEMLTTRQTLDLLRISRTTLYRLIQAGEISPVPSSRALKRPQLRFRRADVEALLNPPSATQP